jgi:para-aminobenzoate synthetase component 1
MTLLSSAMPSPHQLSVCYRRGELRFARIAERAGAVWLDGGSSEQGRYDIISCAPKRRLCLNNHRSGHSAAPALADDDPDASANASIDQHDVFKLAQQWHQPSQGASQLPFYGGVIGYLGYDINQTLEQLSPRPPLATDFPVAWLGYYPWALVQDIPRRRAWLVADSHQALQQGTAVLAEMDAVPASNAPSFTLLSPWQASTDKTDFIAAVQRVQEYIQAGDCYQVNLARHFQARYCGSPWDAYRQLRRALPSPFSAYINTGAGCLLSHSPERLLCVDQDRVITSPIKGTRPRGANPAEDQRLAQELLNSAKDRAENVMIVDLLRNDLGRSCRVGSVRAQQLFALKSYANVHHLVSTIEGRLRSETSALEALKLAFPGGSITGAPKIRAMDIINELEPVARSGYCGSVFYYSNHGRLDSSITIRSMLADGTHMHCWGGGGIVADSEAELEYQEGLTKVRVLLDALTATTQSAGAILPRHDPR